MSKGSSYTPPFKVSTEAINLIAAISAQIERYAIRLEQEGGLRLRKVNRIKTRDRWQSYRHQRQNGS